MMRITSKDAKVVQALQYLLSPEVKEEKVRMYL